MLRILGPVLVAATLCWSSNASAAPGDLDTAFGLGTGKVVTAIGVGNNDYALAIAQQPNGKIVVAGQCYNSNNFDVCLARYLPNGALDTSFNGTGKVTTAIGAGADSAAAITLQPDGKIVVAGQCNVAVCLARYLPSGTLDTSFNGTGKVITALGLRESGARALALQPDGKIIVAGYCSNSNIINIDFCLARYLSNGALDSSFNSTGKVVTALGSGDDVANAIVLQSDGKIVAAGQCYGGNSNDFCLARHLPNGALDSSFNSTGKVITAIGASDDQAISLALQSDGKIVVAGLCYSSLSFAICLARYQPAGVLDATFGANGKVIGATTSFATGVTLQPDGKILVAGPCNNGGDYDFCLARYLPSGALDTSLNSSGIVTTAMGSGDDYAAGVALQPDGNIVVAGHCFNGVNRNFCLARFQGGPNTPKTLTEYVYTPLNYYFLTSRDTEKAILDATAGWSRTGQSFSSLTFADPASRGINRYYFDQIAKNQTRGSHFYTLVDSEKTALAALNPNNQASPRLPYYEGIDSYAFLPVIEGVGGSCAAGQVPVYRAFRGQTRFPDDPNHRFTTSLTLYNQLVAQGWDGEGVKLCAPN